MKTLDVWKIQSLLYRTAKGVDSVWVAKFQFWG